MPLDGDERAWPDPQEAGGARRPRARRAAWRRNARPARGPAGRRHPAGLSSDPSPPVPKGGDIPQRFNAPRVEFQYVRREARIPMRDGAKLYAVLIIPKRRRRASSRSCSTARLIRRTRRPAAAASARWPENILSPLYAELVRAGYIVAVEDVRGKYKSEGEYVMNRPLKGPLNPTASIIRPTPGTRSTGW